MAINMNMSKYVVQQPVKMGTGEAPGHCTNLSVSIVDDGKMGFNWKDPDDGIFGGSKLVIKKGSKPINENDGCIIIDSNIKNQYLEKKCEVEFNESLENDSYYAALFPYSPLGAVNQCRSGILKFQYRKNASFKSCSIDTLIEMIDDESAYSSWNVGDVKTISLNDGTETQLRIDRIDNLNNDKKIFLETINGPYVATSSSGVLNQAKNFLSTYLPAELFAKLKTIKHISHPGIGGVTECMAFVPMLSDYYYGEISVNEPVDTRLTYYKDVPNNKDLLAKYFINGTKITYAYTVELDKLYGTINKTTYEASSGNVSNAKCPIVFVI